MSETTVVEAEVQSIASLRSRVAQLRNELADTTEAYRKATAARDSQAAIPLLRSRSLLMRQLLESQCELLLALRSETPQTL